MSWHPCDRSSCPEWNQGQCFGGGCTCGDIRKAQRIVAELAKVKPYKAEDGYECLFPGDSWLAFKNCRAIAEEGAGDGK